MPYTPGPFDAPHLYLQWGGKLPGLETWSCGLRMAAAGAFTSLDPAGMLSGVTTAVQNYHTAANTLISSQAKLSFVKLNAINEAGHYIEQSTYESVLADLAGGLTPTNGVPNQLALAISLTTGVSRGPAHRGRFYLPLPAMALGSDGLVTTTHRDLVKGTTTTFINALNAVNTNYDVAVFSRKSGAAAHRVVTGHVIGRAVDTQRRRRRKVLEAWA
jgi:hypothetical protein